MNSKNTHQDTPSQNSDVENLISENDTGARAPHDGFGKAALWYIPLIWSLYQLWIASPIPYALGVGVLNDTQTRAIHLAFAVLLAFIAYPGFKKSPRHKIRIGTWGLAIVGVLASSYLCYAYEEVSRRTGAPNFTDVAVSVVGIVLLLEAVRRSMGFPLMGVALFFLVYVFFGSWSGVPEVIQWKGASLNKAMSHMWLTSEGVFGVALGVSSSFVFLFVLFGALLNQAGAGNYFLQLAFAALGHLRGGPAKAAVIASAATGLISGSSIANVVTTGTFTIPLMKKVGFPAHKAGAIEVSSSINGVLTPPVMGAVAFLMTEYVGIPYIEVVKAAIIPAAISYIALVYIVHLEALKMGMKGTGATHPIKVMLGAILIIAASIIIFGSTLYLAGLMINGLQGVLGSFTLWFIGIVLVALYVWAIRFAAQRPDLALSVESLESLPPVREIFKTGMHYLIPILLLMYLLMVERKSPGFSAFWTSLAIMFILATQAPLKAYFRNQGNLMSELKNGIHGIGEGLIAGARNMIGLSCAMAVAGIIVGAVTLTGIGQVMAELVELLSGGNLLAMLFFVALISIVLGMGLPTTANYIVVSSLMASVVVELGAQNGLVVPLIAVHMFVFYFGIMSDVTPPVGLASFAGAAIAKSDPLRTCVQGFYYSIRTALLPFLFIFNTDLLLIDVGPYQAIFVFVIALIAMLLCAAGTMNFFMVRSKIWESATLLFVAFMLFQPGVFLDRIQPEYDVRSAEQVYAYAESMEDNTAIRVRMKGESLEGDLIDAHYLLPLGSSGASGEDRLSNNAGITLREEGGQLFVDQVTYYGPAEKLGIDFDWQLVEINVKADRLPKEIFYIPAFMLLGLVLVLQLGRLRKEKALNQG